MKDYYVSIFYSEEDNAYVADIPDLEYCSALGQTQEEALHELMKAKAAWLDAAQKAGKPIPEARYKPFHHSANK
jgi:predicted RNase H-like HicB family nuclease